MLKSSDGPIKGIMITTADFYPDTSDFITDINESIIKPKNYQVTYNFAQLMKLMAGFEEFQAQRIIKDFYLVKKNK